MNKSKYLYLIIFFLLFLIFIRILKIDSDLKVMKLENEIQKNELSIQLDKIERLNTENQKLKIKLESVKD